MQAEATMDASMIKIGPVGNSSGKTWDEKGRSEIVQIFVSHDDQIFSLQFQYFKDGNVVLSPKYGSSNGSKFDAVKLNYPSEYLTCVSGFKGTAYINSVSFTTNFGTYGPFGAGRQSQNSDNKEFWFQLGKDKQFGGFCGSADNYLRSIGVYIKPIRTLNIQQSQNQNGSTLDEAECVEIQRQL